MELVFLALPFGIIMGAGSVILFLWSVKSGQLDDLTTPPRRILTDETARDSRPVPSDNGKTPAV